MLGIEVLLTIDGLLITLLLLENKLDDDELRDTIDVRFLEPASYVFALSPNTIWL